MNKLNEFIQLLQGKFDNSQQFNELKEGNIEFPYAKHINTVCNDKIRNIPEDFEGVFLLEESYYTVNDQNRSSSHLFLFKEEDEGIKLISYVVPGSKDLTYDSFEEVDFNDLQISSKFNPAIYKYNDGIYEGGSVSMFSPVLKFSLFERFSKDYLEVSETMEVNGKRTFGYDQPIIYRRIK